MFLFCRSWPVNTGRITGIDLSEVILGDVRFWPLSGHEPVHCKYPISGVQRTLVGHGKCLLLAVRPRNAKPQCRFVLDRNSPSQWQALVTSHLHRCDIDTTTHGNS